MGEHIHASPITVSEKSKRFMGAILSAYDWS